jgi:hypothetical protein
MGFIKQPAAIKNFTSIGNVVGLTSRQRNPSKRKRLKYKQIYKEWKSASIAEVWEGVRDNFIWGFLSAILVVFIATKIDIAVFSGYLMYYFYVGRILNRPKYVTEFGKLIVFPIPTAIGAFVGYKLSYYLISFLS